MSSVARVLATDVVTRFAAGEPDAVRSVYREYVRLVHAVASRVLNDRTLAEEATQQTFVQAWRAAASFDPRRELAPWLVTIARRVAIDVHRREARRAHDSVDALSVTDPALVTDAPSAEQIYDVWEVRQAVDALPEDEREIVRLQHLEGLTHQDIATRLAMPVGTVKSRSFRAHKRLAARLGHLRDAPANRPDATDVQEGR
jgi:RNA polymerase sigma factor (sigma-70 family)